MVKHRGTARAVSSWISALSLVLLALLGACATKKAAPLAVPPESAPKAIAEIAPAIGIDQHRARLPFVLKLENPRSREIRLESFECVLRVAGAEADRLEGREAVVIEAGGSASIPLEFPVDSRKLSDAVAGHDGPATAAFRIEASVRFRDSAGSALEASASADSSFPIIREPRLRILSLKIERDILVTTNLRLAVEVENPNAFPISLGSLAYDFYGEGRPWSGGTASRPLMVPGRASARLPLAFELNFADRDRALLDLVAKLMIVSYRLKGSAAVATGLEFLPEFRLEFDEDGEVRVEQ
jgi:LEA14-like dessication related protein